MPFTWQININKQGAGFVYDPNPLNASENDQIFWSNNDDKVHWPGLPGNDTYFMEDKIQPGNSSDTFILKGVPKGGSIAYIDSEHPKAPGGKIDVPKT